MAEMILVRRDEYDRLCAAAEDLEDLLAYDRAMLALRSGDEELVPEAIADRLIDSESPLRVYRQWREMTQEDLARQAGVSRVLVAEIERGAKTGSVETLRRLASVLQVTIDDLLPVDRSDDRPGI